MALPLTGADIGAQGRMFGAGGGAVRATGMISGWAGKWGYETPAPVESAP